MENTLEIYNKLKSVPKEFLKTIQAGRLKGMSDIKPQWRIQKLTEVFGACGFGWNIQNISFEYVSQGEETVCNCRLEFLYKNEKGEWSLPIPATGGSNFSTFENKTDYATQQKIKVLYVSDEAEKMALTDAISVATKMIGLASDVYMGYGGKYDKDTNPPENDSLKKTPPSKTKNATADFLNNVSRSLEKISSIDDFVKYGETEEAKKAKEFSNTKALLNAKYKTLTK